MIDHIHLKDAPPDFDWSARLGEGRGHFKEVAALIREKGYCGWLVSENYYCMGPLGRNFDPIESASVDLATMHAEFSSKNLKPASMRS